MAKEIHCYEVGMVYCHDCHQKMQYIGSKPAGAPSCWTYKEYYRCTKCGHEVSVGSKERWQKEMESLNSHERRIRNLERSVK